MKLKWNLQQGLGFRRKNPFHGRGMDVFLILELHKYMYMYIINSGYLGRTIFQERST